jgi:hypothetical protein
VITKFMLFPLRKLMKIRNDDITGKPDMCLELMNLFLSVCGRGRTLSLSGGGHPQVVDSRVSGT